MSETSRANPEVVSFFFIKEVTARSTVFRLPTVALFDKAANRFFQSFLRIQGLLNGFSKVFAAIIIVIINKAEKILLDVRKYIVQPFPIFTLIRHSTIAYLSCLVFGAILPIVLIPN